MELPLGATPPRIFRLSLGVKFTNETVTDLLEFLGLEPLTGRGALID